LKGLKKENSELLVEIEGLRAQLDDALTKNYQSYTQIADYRYHNCNEFNIFMHKGGCHNIK
jgi:hypothetical protein